MLECLAELRRLGYRIFLDGDAIRYRYIGLTAPRTDAVPSILIDLRRNKQTVIKELRREAEAGWPLESYEAEARFGTLVARLYPFIGRQVATPEGTGRLLRVFHAEALVEVNGDPEGVRRFAPSDLRPLPFERKGEDE